MKLKWQINDEEPIIKELDDFDLTQIKLCLMPGDMGEQFSTEHIAKAVEKLIEEPKQSIADDLKAYFIQMLHNADFVQVVRCEDCKHLVEIDDTSNLYVCARIDIGMDGEPDFLNPKNDFCSKGERKETEK